MALTVGHGADQERDAAVGIQGQLGLFRADAAAGFDIGGEADAAQLALGGGLGLALGDAIPVGAAGRLGRSRAGSLAGW